MYGLVRCNRVEKYDDDDQIMNEWENVTVSFQPRTIPTHIHSIVFILTLLISFQKMETKKKSISFSISQEIEKNGVWEENIRSLSLSLKFDS